MGLGYVIVRHSNAIVIPTKKTVSECKAFLTYRISEQKRLDKEIEIINSYEPEQL